MRNLIIAAAIILFCNSSCGSASNAEKVANRSAIQYSCMPCGAACDKTVFNEPGKCSHCNMEMVDKSTIRYKNIQPENMCLLDAEKMIFLDVRTPDEFNGTAEEKFGSIKNAINIPVQELQTRINELEKFRDSEIVVYCSHSHRSPRASYMLTQAGFKNVTNMDGGMSVWKEKVRGKECNDKLYLPQ